MSLSFLIPNRTVLLVSDDALYIYTSGAKKVELVEVVPWDAKGFVENVAGIIVKDCGKKPVLLLNDMVEQHYRKERILRSGVNSLDRSAMLKRRLSVAFGSYSVRAAFPLKEKIPKVAGQPAADLYIFAAVPDTDQLDKAMLAVRRSLVSVAGLCLLPVESSDMLKALSQKLTKKGRGTAMWSVFIGQHQSGGLRQVITKNGELALTRMTPMSATRDNVDLWSQEVHKEFRATMSYLSRFGYDVEDGLDVTIVANASAAESLEGLIEEDCNLNIMSVSEAANLLGVSIGSRHNPDYADVLHVAWAGRKTKFALPMKAGRVDEVHRPRQVAMVATLALLMGASFLSYQFMGEYGRISEIYNDMDSVKKRKAQLDLQYQREVQRKEAMGFDVRLVQSAIAVYDQLESKNIKALDLFKGIGRALGKDFRVDGIKLERASVRPVDRFIKRKTVAPLFKATMKMTYPGTTNVDQGNQEVRSLRDRLGIVLSGHDVKVTKFLKDYEYTEGLVVETGDLEKENLQQDFVAEIVIQGPVPEEGEKR